MDNDYIKELSYDEKIAFIKIFCKLIRADQNIDDKEIDFLDLIASRYGISKNEVAEIIRNSDYCNHKVEACKITNRQHALELIKELCVLANTDDDLHDKEVDIIADVAEAMRIEENKVLTINRWVLDCAIVQKTGDIIMERKHG